MTLPMRQPAGRLALLFAISVVALSGLVSAARIDPEELGVVDAYPGQPEFGTVGGAGTEIDETTEIENKRESRALLAESDIDQDEEEDFNENEGRRLLAKHSPPKKKKCSPPPSHKKKKCSPPPPKPYPTGTSQPDTIIQDPSPPPPDNPGDTIPVPSPPPVESSPPVPVASPPVSTPVPSPPPVSTPVPSPPPSTPTPNPVPSGASPAPYAHYIVDCTLSAPTVNSFPTIQLAVNEVVASKTDATKVANRLKPTSTIPGFPNAIVIYVKGKCTYNEKITIPGAASNLVLWGDGPDQVTLTWHDLQSTTGSTRTAASTLASGDYFMAIGITFENSSGPQDRSSFVSQAPAITVEGLHAVFFNVIFSSWQDTVYDNQGKHYYFKSFMEGSVDFICGNGQAVFDNCVLMQRDIGAPYSPGSLTAQKRNFTTDTTGYVFRNIYAYSEAAAQTTRLGRAWGAASRTVFLSSSLNDIANTVDVWSDWKPAWGTSEFYFGEWKTVGKPVPFQRLSFAKPMTDSDAAPFNTLNFINYNSDPVFKAMMDFVRGMSGGTYVDSVYGTKLSALGVPPV